MSDNNKNEVILVDSKIHVTTDYDLFVFMEGNRNVNTVHLSRVMNSISKKQLPIPIIVTPCKSLPGKYEIFEGQHRYVSLRQLEKPIYYIILDNLMLEDAITINSIAKKWTAEDYFTHYLAQGIESYVLLKNFMEITGLSLHNARTFLDINSAKGSRQQGDFINGTFMIKDWNLSMRLFEQHLDFSDCPAFKRTNCKLAIIKIMTHAKYDHERMRSKLDQGLAHKITNRTSTSDYLMLFSDVYNYNASKGTKVYFHLDED